MFGSVYSFFRPASERLAARSLYEAIVAQARLPAFYADMGVPDTPIGRFDLVVLHGFLVLRRLRAETGAARLSRAVAEVLVDDLDRNLREMGEGDLSVGKKVKLLTRGAYGRMEAYLAALAGGQSAVEAALLRNLYAERSPGAERLHAMAAYVLRETEALARQPGAALCAGTVAFGPPPVAAAA